MSPLASSPRNGTVMSSAGTSRMSPSSRRARKRWLMGARTALVGTASKVATIRLLGRFGQGLRQRRVDEQALHDVADGEVGGDREGDHGDQLGGVATDDRPAQHHPGGGVRD